MLWWQAGLWALAGGFVVEGLEFAAVLRRYRKWPWQVDADVPTPADGAAAGPLGYFIGELVRLMAGAILGAALAGQITAPLPALAIGAAAPVVAGQLAAFLPTSTSFTTRDDIPAAPGVPPNGIQTSEVAQSFPRQPSVTDPARKQDAP